MSQHTTISEIPEPPFDYIDFPVSDTYRDHFAAQGLTYPSGRRPPLPASSEVSPMPVFPPDDQRREAEVQRFEERIKRLGTTPRKASLVMVLSSKPLFFKSARWSG